MHGQGARQGSEARVCYAGDGKKNLLQVECSRLKAKVEEVETTMKEMLESMDKLQANLDEANS